MKYIGKSIGAAEVVAYEKELADNQLDKVSLADSSIHPSLDGAAVYDVVKSFAAFAGLKSRLFADQGGICCYCGCKLQYPNHPQYIIEHVFPKKERKNFFHCDKAKESEVLTITPLQEDCQKHFVYDMFGGVEGVDEDAQNDIKTLNLDCEWLNKRREAAIDGEIYDESGELLPDDELRHRLDTIMKLDNEGLHTEFCFVIQNVIRNLLSPGA